MRRALLEMFASQLMFMVACRSSSAFCDFSLCAADCDDNFRVEISELAQAARIVLGGDAQTCHRFGGFGEAATVIDLVRAINQAPLGVCRDYGEIFSFCGDGRVECEEECDPGGVCVGGSMSGTACTSDASCGRDEPGRCTGGAKAYWQCSDDADCDGGQCKRCVVFGGHAVPGGTCASNCTLETELEVELKEGVFHGASLLAGSGAVVHSGILGDVPIALRGMLTLSIGKELYFDGRRPVRASTSALALPAVPISTIACSCLRSVSAKSCGGVLTFRDGSPSPDCSDGFSPGERLCSAAGLPPCTFVHGEGNTASGVLGCAGLTPIDVSTTQDLGGSQGPIECLTPGFIPPCNDPVGTYLSGSGPPGSMLLLQHLAHGFKTGSCTEWCSDADSQSQRIWPQFLTTGTAGAVIFNLDGQDGVDIGPCPQLFANPSGLKLCSSLTAINRDVLGDTVVDTCFEAK